MTKVEIIDDTVNYYLDDPSRFASSLIGGYEYLTSDGRACAVGRCLDLPLQYPQNAKSVDCEDVFAACRFKKPYQGHEQGFWVDVQKLHDTPCNWDKVNKCLTPIGVQYVDRIKSKWLASPV